MFIRFAHFNCRLSSLVLDILSLEYPMFIFCYTCTQIYFVNDCPPTIIIAIAYICVILQFPFFFSFFFFFNHSFHWSIVNIEWSFLLRWFEKCKWIFGIRWETPEYRKIFVLRMDTFCIRLNCEFQLIFGNFYRCHLMYVHSLVGPLNKWN